VINLLPIPSLIAVISGIYAVLIVIILLFFLDADVDRIEGVKIAFRGATVLNVILLGVVYFGWRWLWKQIPFLNDVLFPDLNGEWDMTIHWRWNGKEGVAKATAHIKQSFLKISMEVDSEDSQSTSMMAKPKKDSESGRAILYYIYRSTPKLTVGNNSIPYEGTAILKLDHKNFKILEGNYYTDRSTKGHYKLKRRDA